MTLKQALIDELQAAFKTPDIEVMSDDDVHFYVTMADAAFKGMPLLAQHKKVYDALSTELKQAIHALSLHTSVKGASHE